MNTLIASICLRFSFCSCMNRIIETFSPKYFIHSVQKFQTMWTRRNGRRPHRGYTAALAALRWRYGNFNQWRGLIAKAGVESTYLGQMNGSGSVGAVVAA